MELTLPRLPRPRRRELIRLGRKTKDIQTGLRFLMIAKLGAGLSKTEGAQALDSAVSTVVLWAVAFGFRLQDQFGYSLPQQAPPSRPRILVQQMGSTSRLHRELQRQVPGRVPQPALVRQPR